MNISKPKLLAIKIPVPPLKIQREIVEILNNFDSLANDISVGIPAEINARRLQYEYYRNKLLSFRELEKV
jgi:type I restriction enzyme S subunit